ncbi:ECF transporter S component [Peptoniphilus equinus]|uniref:Riboflavin transporter n=1 Tax=Peptoniphilus equinus TaxID=3016343 RepID=A0ABY7QS83_9FIRM|nr:ECF transporter S component [Peptoniphilus equinus]WBW49653.1 ECF transporter S component [Peptoniphilus equinus]
MNKVSRTRVNVRVISRIGMLSAIAVVLMMFQVPVTFVVPSFIKLDVSELPALIGAFTMGPVAAIIISALKNILNILLQGTSTGFVGELSNFLLASIFTATAGFIYQRKHTFVGAMMGMLVGAVVMTFGAVISNFYFIFPLYSNFMPMEAIVNASHAVNSNVHDLWDIMIYCIVPFNLLKAFLTSLVTLLIYKKISPLFRA